RLAAAVDAGQVGVEDGLPVLVLHPHQQVVAGDAGVVYEDRDRADVLADRLDQLFDRAGRADVEHAATAALRRPPVAVLLGAAFAGRGTDDRRAARGELIGNRRADAAACAGHQRDLAFQFLGHASSPVSVKAFFATDRRG